VDLNVGNRNQDKTVLRYHGVQCSFSGNSFGNCIFHYSDARDHNGKIGTVELRGVEREKSLVMKLNLKDISDPEADAEDGDE
jgi:hypothetical protein